ncbi:hypothetical protein ACODT5_19840 [Streptomyces sp. 5.8]
MTDEEFEELMEQARAEVRRTAFSDPVSVDDGEYAFRTQHAEFGAPAH